MTLTAPTLLNWLSQWLSNKLGFAPDRIDPTKPFAEYGLDSVAAVELAQALQEWFACPLKLDPTLAWDYPTPVALADYLLPLLNSQAADQDANTSKQTQPAGRATTAQPIAVIGMGLRFPGADSPDSFWALLCSQQNPVREIPAARWVVDDYYDPTPATPGKMSTRHAALLGQVDQFDARFFGISAQLATELDPQQRLLLEVCWEALEQAGIMPKSLAGTQTGVYIGISTNDYAWLATQAGVTSPYRGLGNAHAIAANHISYLLDLRGPSVAIDTACSSALVALHQACQGLRTGEIDQALVGAVNLTLTPDLFVTFANARMLSPTGRCATFDATADGYVRGEGAGMVVLKRLADAERNGDSILAVIRGSAVNQDGRSNGLTAPSGAAQQAVIRAALQAANVTPDQISYVEAHGTGTPLGDPIEINALHAVLLEERRPDQRCWIGAVKSQIGHLEAAAGMAGLIKTILCLQHKMLPANLHLHTLNPQIKLGDTPLEILRAPQAWAVAGATPRLAGVSAFGFGGTNAHVILAEAPARPQPENRATRPWHVLTVTAKNAAALRTLAERYTTFLHTHPDISIGDFCHTANVGRTPFAWRQAFVAADSPTLQQQLTEMAQSLNQGDEIQAANELQASNVVFLFTGQGAQYNDMGRQLYETQPVFWRALDQCDAIVRSLLGESLVDLLYPPIEHAPRHPQPAPLDTTRYAQPALFAVEYALAELWRSWGVTPALVMGHSLGEYVAACVAGAFTLEEGLHLVVERGRLMQALPQTGTMAAIFASVEQVQAVIAPFGDAVTIAAMNAPQNVVIAGETTTVQQVCATFAAQGIETQALKVSHAFHSAQIEPTLADLAQAVNRITPKPLQLPLVSNVTGKILPVGTTLDAAYWCKHSRCAVQWLPGLTQALAAAFTLFLEIGPSAVLTSFGKQLAPTATWLPSLQRNSQAWPVLLESLTELYQQGIKIDWQAFDQPYSYQRIAIPTYPFQRQRYWVADASADSPIFRSTELTNRKEFDPNQQPKPSQQRLFINQPTNQTPNPQDHRAAILANLQQLTAKLLHIPLDDVQTHTPLVELGADSLILLEAMRQIDAHYGVKLSVRSFFAELATLDALATYLAAHTPRTQPATLELPTIPLCNGDATAKINPPSFPGAAAFPVAEIVQLFEQQIEALQRLANEQINLLRTLSAEPAKIALLLPPNGSGLSLPSNGLLLNSNGRQKNGHNGAHITHPLENGVAAPVITPAPTAPNATVKIIPLSEAQQRLWWLCQMSEAAALAYNESVSLWLRGPLQFAALHQAVQTLVDRHEALRTVISRTGDEQQILPSLALALPLVDLTAPNDQTQPVRVAAWLAAESRQPVDLTAGPLFRVHLLKLAADEHLLVVTGHHLILDGSALGILLHEVSALYSAACQGETLRLQPAAQFSQHIAWQAAQRTSPALAAHEAYWLQTLAGDLPVLELPLDYPRPAQPSYCGAIESLSIDATLTQALQQFSRQQGATLFMTLLAAYFTLLHRLSGQDDVIVSVPTAGREMADGASVVGYCINLLPVRSQLGDRPSFVDLLQTVRATLLDAYEHAEYPFARLLSTLQAQPNFNVLPLLSSVFNFNAQMAPPPFYGLQATIGPRPTSFVDHDFSVNVLDIGATLVIDFEYSQDLFAASTVQRMAGHFATLLRALVSEPNTPVRTLPLLTAAQRQQQLGDWNATARPFDADLGVYQRFLAQVQQTPNAYAVSWRDQQWTYAEIAARAAQIAEPIRAQGIDPDTVVAVLAQRSPTYLAAILAIFKTSGAYLPLDLRSPAARLAQVVQQSTTPLILATREFSPILSKALALLPVGQLPTVLWLDEFSAMPPVASAQLAEQPVRTQASDLAYVIYTSGSTGVPKGAMVEQRGLVNHLLAMQENLQLTANDVIAQSAPQSYVISVWQCLAPLLTGARVEIIPEEVAMDPASLLRTIAERQVTILQIVPSLLRLMLPAIKQAPQLLASLRWLIPTGEALPPALVREWFALCPQIPLLNAYGASECSDDVAHDMIIEPPTETVVNMPAGRPIANVQMYVLDEQMQPAPIGIEGDLYVGGACVGRGYLNDHARTAAVFQRNPFSADPNARLYKTGDRARWLADGKVEYRGRRDFQVKLRGMRIELGEIEAVLEQHPAVKQAVVLARTAAGGEQQLVAFVVERNRDQRSEIRDWRLETDAEPTNLQVTDLRRYLSGKLPDYMTPATFVLLDKLPLTYNGKTDRKALLATALPESAAAQPISPPRTPIEEQLVNIWAGVLGLTPQQVGIHHDFFALGGHSLLAAQVAARIRETFGLDLPLRAYFHEPTIAHLGEFISATQWVNQAVTTLSATANADEEEWIL